MSTGGATVLCDGLRGIKAGFNRASTSFNGSDIESESYSSPVRNREGAAVRNSPKVILTAPNASCGKTFLTGTEIIACCKSTPPSIHLDRKSAGKRSRIGINGISNSDRLAPRAGVAVYCPGSETACRRGSPGTECKSETIAAVESGCGPGPPIGWFWSG